MEEDFLILHNKKGYEVLRQEKKKTNRCQVATCKHNIHWNFGNTLRIEPDWVQTLMDTHGHHAQSPRAPSSCREGLPGPPRTPPGPGGFPVPPRSGGSAASAPPTIPAFSARRGTQPDCPGNTGALTARSRATQGSAPRQATADRGAQRSTASAGHNICMARFSEATFCFWFPRFKTLDLKAVRFFFLDKVFSVHSFVTLELILPLQSCFCCKQAKTHEQ